MTTIQKLHFADFIKQYPNGEGIFELVDEEII